MQPTLRQKIGQLFMLGFRGPVAAPDSSIIRAIRDQHLGGVWLSDKDNPLGATIGNVESPAQLRALVKSLKAAAAFPLLVSIDAEGGRIIRLKEIYGFPPTLSAAELGRRNDLALTRDNTETICRMLLDAGINFNFVPVLDLLINPDNPPLARKQRCYSADPDVVYTHAAEVARIHRQHGIQTSAKHFPGHGSSAGDSHHGLVDVTDSWSEKELLPYRRLQADGLLDSVMPAHIYVKQFDPDLPASLSPRIIDGLLRGKIAFHGLVISDDLNMGAIADNYTIEESVRLGFLAGNDILVHTNTIGYDEDMAERLVDITLRLVEGKEIPMSRIDNAWNRVKHAKEKAARINQK